MCVSFVVRVSKGREESREERIMDLNMSRVDVRELMCELWCDGLVY